MSINQLKKLGMVGRPNPAMAQPVPQRGAQYHKGDTWQKWAAEDDSEDLYAEADRYSGDSMAQDDVDDHRGPPDRHDDDDELEDDSDLADLDFDLKAQTEYAKKEIKAEEERELQRLEAERRQREEAERKRLEEEQRKVDEKLRQEAELKKRIAEEKERQTRAEGEHRRNASGSAFAAGDTVNSVEMRSRRENSEK